MVAEIILEMRPLKEEVEKKGPLTPEFRNVLQLFGLYYKPFSKSLTKTPLYLSCHCRKFCLEH